jgi:EAL domain-containing protein (putative c-di-GMP-specific phosphodiesterase class I)
MHRLGALGIRFAIDDFGVGYSSLSYLERLPIHTIKIDRSFIRDVESNPAQAKLIAGIISLARGLQIHVVAEGVENGAQLDIVRAYGCDEVQGHFFSAPQPAIDLELSTLRTRQCRRSHLPAVASATEVHEL